MSGKAPETPDSDRTDLKMPLDSEPAIQPQAIQAQANTVADESESASELLLAKPNPLWSEPAIGPKIIPFRNLCRCGDEVWIENDGTIYRLRRTRLGKLILTK